MRAEAGVRPVRERRSARSRRGGLRSLAPSRRLVVSVLASLVAAALAGGLAFAGSDDRIAAGVTIAGVNVGGMTPAEARAALSKRAARYASVPVVFTAGSGRWALPPDELDARVDWAAFAEEGRAAGDWPAPVRGLKRVAVRLFGVEVEPRAEVFEPRLEHELARIEREVDRPGRHASIVLRGLEPTVLPERSGRALDRTAAQATITKALAGFDRRPVALPIRVERPDVTAEDLRPVAAQVRTALSAPVGFRWKDARWLVAPEQVAELLLLPANGASELRIGGPKADRYFKLLSRAVDRKPRNARFAVWGDGTVRVVPGKSGRALDIAATEEALLAAALATEQREAQLVVVTRAPKLTTKQARAMGVTRVLASYSTAYSGTSDRIRNLQRAVSLIDGTRLAPGETFSLNEVVGPRTEERGFRMAPTIMDGEYKDAIGGGVSQVATTVFNAAWEAGLKITERTAHTLYISRYPLGRDATVNYPDIDLKFENDTDKWVIVKGGYDDAGISISLLGGGSERRVVSEAGELEETGPPEVEKVPDPTLFVGQKVVEDEGEPSRAVTVTRVVYEGGKVLHEETWYTSYDSEPKIVRVGTIPRPKEAPKPPPKKDGGKNDGGKNDGGKTPTTPTTPTTTGP